VIIPFPRNLFNFLEYPITWTLLVLNLLLFFFLSEGFNKKLETSLYKDRELIVAAHLYKEYLQTRSLSKDFIKFNSLDVQSINFFGKKDQSENLIALGLLALRNNEFIKYALTHSFHGDQVRIEEWKSRIRSYTKYRENSVFNVFGLSYHDQSPFHWVTYQFIHSGLTHLMFNMLFLLFIGSAVEGLIGGLGTILVFIVGGVFGGIFYLIFNTHGGVPVVGASASLSALISFYLLHEPRQRIRYLYVFSPSSQHYGLIYLPKLLIFPLFILSDMTYLLAMDLNLSTSIAHSAHLGGFFAGMVLALMEKFLNLFHRSKTSSHGVFSNTDGL